MTPKRIDEIAWWHSMNLPNGERTVGRNNPAEHFPKLCLPDLKGKTVLDVGAWDGFYTFECARLGADSVLATDSYVWNHPRIGFDGFLYAFQAQPDHLRERIATMKIDVLELNIESVGAFDVVLCLGVLYHMRHPMLMLERVFSVVKPGGLLVLETAIDALKETRPAAIFYETDELNGDPSNWFGPNPAMVLAMCRANGFTDVRVAHQDARLVVHARRPL